MLSIGCAKAPKPLRAAKPVAAKAHSEATELNTIIGPIVRASTPFGRFGMYQAQWQMSVPGPPALPSMMAKRTRHGEQDDAQPNREHLNQSPRPAFGEVSTATATFGNVFSSSLRFPPIADTSSRSLGAGKELRVVAPGRTTGI